MHDGSIGDRHLSLRDQVLAELRSRIIDAYYRPGERLTEDRLAADFGVSRNPVREALRVVEAEGFVELQPRRGAIVAEPDERTMRDMFATRAVLEPLGARIAAEHATDLRAGRPAPPAGRRPRRHAGGRLRAGRRAEQRPAPSGHADVGQPVAGAVLHRDVPPRALGLPARAPPPAPPTPGRSTYVSSRPWRHTTRTPPSGQRATTCMPRRPPRSTGPGWQRAISARRRSPGCCAGWHPRRAGRSRGRARPRRAVPKSTARPG